MGKTFTVSDGKLVLQLRPADQGWYAVTSPMDPALQTQGKTIEEAFAMADDALKCLKSARARLGKRLASEALRRDKPVG